MRASHRQCGLRGIAVSWDVLVRHGLIIDGSGRPGGIGYIAAGDGRILALGASFTGDATKVTLQDFG